MENYCTEKKKGLPYKIPSIGISVVNIEKKQFRLQIKNYPELVDALLHQAVIKI